MMNLYQSNVSSTEALLAESDHFVLVDTVFRDYDIRGLAGSELNPEFALRLGKAVGQSILNLGQNTVYIARDGRLSSDALSESLCSGLRQSGCHVVDLGQTTTPILNFAICHRTTANCGVMITASHNPGHYNGFKIVLEGQVIPSESLQDIKALITANNFPVSPEGSLSSLDIVPSYLDFIVASNKVSRPFKLVIDGCNSVCGPLAVALFQRLGCTVDPLYCSIDGNFPNHDPNPSEQKNLQPLIRQVKSTRADLGLAFDGDGDRLVVVSQHGEIVWPDRLMMIFAQNLLVERPGSTVVFDIKSSKRLGELIKQHSGVPVMCKTGHSHIRKAVRNNNALLGGEFSGHIFFNDRWRGFDDGCYAAMRLLEILSAKWHGQITSLDQIIAEFKETSYTPEILVPVAEADKFEIMETLASQCNFAGGSICSLDGLRVEYENGWGLIRASNTTPNLTLRFEAENDVELEIIKQHFYSALSPFINNLEDYI
jgi:phosphomannomutase/phosphoglucomutase